MLPPLSAFVGLPPPFTTAGGIACALNIILVGYSTAANLILVFTIHTTSSCHPETDKGGFFLLNSGICP